MTAGEEYDGVYPSCSCGRAVTYGVCDPNGDGCALRPGDCGCQPVQGWRQQPRLRTVPRPDAVTASTAGKHPAIDWHDVWKGQPAEVNWIIPDFLEAGSSNAMFGKPGSGKSLLALELAARLAKAGTVVTYIDEENRVVDHVDRLQSMGYGPHDLDRLRMYSFPRLPALDTAIGGIHLHDLATVDGAQLVILDTTSRMINGRENDADTWLQVYRCSLLPLKGAGITVLRLDHPGKDETRGQRGSSAKDGDVDTVWHLTVVHEGLDYRLARQKTRSGNGPQEFTLRRRYEPLRHEWAVPGTTEIIKIAGQLEALQIPPEAGRPTVRKALTANGIEIGNAQLTAAIRHRKTVRGQPRTARTASDQTDHCPSSPPIGEDSGQSPDRDCSNCHQRQARPGGILCPHCLTELS